MIGPRRDPRVPLQLRIRLAPGSLDDFIERHARNANSCAAVVRNGKAEVIASPRKGLSRGSSAGGR